MIHLVNIKHLGYHILWKVSINLSPNFVIDPINWRIPLLLPKVTWQSEGDTHDILKLLMRDIGGDYLQKIISKDRILFLRLL